MKKTAFISSPGKMALILFCLLTFPCLNAFSQIPGDVNADGFINHADLILVKDHILNRNVLDGDALTYRDSNEYPRHEVTLSAYYIGKYEITNGQYCAVLNWAKGMGYLENSSGGSYTGGNVYKNGIILLYVNSSYCQITYSGGSFIWQYSMENHPVVMVS